MTSTSPAGSPPSSPRLLTTERRKEVLIGLCRACLALKRSVTREEWAAHIDPPCHRNQIGRYHLRELSAKGFVGSDGQPTARAWRLFAELTGEEAPTD